MPKTKKSSGSEAVVVGSEDAESLENSNSEAVVDSDATDGDDNGDVEAGGNDVDEATNGGTSSGDAAPIKKTLGAKEVIPFAWKVIGLSGEMILTLFKSVERVDADTQLDRLDKDGTYKDLRVVPIHHRIVQPKSVKNDFVAKAFRDKKEGAETRASTKRSSSTKKTVSTIVAQRKPSAKKTGKKAAAKSVKKSAAKKAPKAKKADTKTAKKKAKKKPAAKAPSKSAKKTTKKAPRKKKTAKTTKKKVKAAKKKK